MLTGRGVLQRTTLWNWQLQWRFRQLTTQSISHPADQKLSQARASASAGRTREVRASDPGRPKIPGTSGSVEHGVAPHIKLSEPAAPLAYTNHWQPYSLGTVIPTGKAR